jgi:hypothetical protein
MRLAGVSTVAMALLVSAGASAATPTPTAMPPGAAEPTATPTATAPAVEAPADETPAPTPSATPIPPSQGLVLQELEVPPEEMVGPPAPDHPIGRIEGQLTVQDKKKKKKKSDEPPQEELAGKVKTDEDKQWLSEVCPLDENHGGSWLDRSQQRLGWSVCRATLWFDGLFGDERAVTERDATYGYVEPKLGYNEHDGIDPDAKVRAKYSLPVANRRFNALIGRNDENADQRESRSSEPSEQLPESFREADDEWLVGLGYSPVRGNRKRIDFDAGLKLSTSPDVFVQGRYRRHWFMGEDNLVRFRDAVFWRSDDGLGTRVDIDYERVLAAHPLVFRWRNSGTYAQRVEGVDWFEELTLFHRLGLKTALAYVLNADGETDAEVPVRNYGFELVYRRNILREWLFIELRPGVDWRRREVEDQRKLEPVFLAGLQINFGDRDFE